MLPAGEMWSVVMLSPSTRQHARARRCRATRLGRLARHALEVGRVLDVGRRGVPGVAVARRARQRAPALVARRTRRRSSGGTSRAGCDCATASCDLLAGVGQMSRRKTGWPSRAVAERLVVEVDVDAPGQGVGDDQRRRHQVVGPHLGVDAALEVAVARQHRGDDQVALARSPWRSSSAAGRSCRCRSCSRSRRCGSRAVEVAASARPRCRYSVTTFEPGASEVFTQGLRCEAPLDRLLRQQAGGEHHRRVRGVGAARDRGDDDRAVRQRVAPCSDRAHRRGASPSRQRPRRLAVASACAGLGAAGWARAATAAPSSNDVLRVAQGARGPAGASGPARLGSTVLEVQLQRVGVHRPPACRRCGTGPAPCSRPRPARPARLGAAGEAQVAQRLGVDREDAAGGAVLGRHVGDRGAVGQRQRRPGRGRRTRRTCRPRPSCAASR